MQKQNCVYIVGGLAAPLFVGGAVLAGTATTTGATVIGGLVSKDKLKKAQEALDEDKKLVTQIEEKRISLESLSTKLSNSYGLQPEEFLGFLIIASLRVSSTLFIVIGAIWLYPVAVRVVLRLMLIETSRKVGKGFAVALAGISLKGLAAIVRSVLAATLGGVLVFWDVIQLVDTIYDLSNKSETAVARNLREIAGKLATQTGELERMLKQARQQGQDFETMIKKQFRQRLEAISKKGYATEYEANEVYDLLNTLTTSEWKQHFDNVGGDLRKFVFEIARVFHLIYNQVERHTRTEKEREQGEGELTVILIAHGRINTTLMLPICLYYPTFHMKAVTLYEPWGCSIDASVVYGIAANSIQLKNVSYSGVVYIYQTIPVPAIPTYWNTLNKNEGNSIPTATFSPVLVGEGAYTELMALISFFQLKSKDLVLPYFTGDGKDILPFPEVPLCVITTVLGLIGSLLNTHITLRVAACLSVPDGDIARPTEVINCWQYYFVSPNQNVVMTNQFTDQERHMFRPFNLNALNKFL